MIALLSFSATVWTAPPATAAVDCAALTPAADPQTNYDNIQGCLDGPTAMAYLTPGTYPVERGITVPTGAVLREVSSPNGFTWPTIRLDPADSPATTNYLVKFVGSGARVALVQLDGNGQLNPQHGAIVHIAGSDNQLDNSHIYGGAAGVPTPGNPSALRGQTGVYVICDTCAGNMILNNKIHSNYYGIILRGADATAVNTAASNDIYDIECDPITFAGYGVAENNNIYENGWACANHIPGGGVYSATNAVGFKLTGNTIRASCGHGIDIVTTQHAVIDDNVVRNPGESSRDPGHTYCGGAAGIALMDVGHSYVRRNDARNTSPWNVRDHDNNHVFSDTAPGTPAYSDLPNGANTIMAFQLTWNRNPSWPTVTNDIRNNVLVANCPVTNCVGLGFFVSRGTGKIDGHYGDSVTWNKFRGNRVYGSENNSRRGGSNWYAGSLDCPTREAWAIDGCNDDDYRHNPPTGSTYRNDKFYEYTG